MPFEYLQELVNVEILRQAASDLGVQPSEEGVEEALRRQFEPTAPEGQEVDPGQLDREFRNNYQTFLTATGLTDSKYRVIVEEDLTEFGLFLKLGQEVENSQEHVEVRWIRLPIDPNEAGASGLLPDQVAQRLEVEPFDVVAREVSRSAGYSDASGNVGWVPRGAFPNLDPLLFGDEERGTVALKPGETSSPFYARDGIFIVQMLAGPEERDVEGTHAFQAGSRVDSDLEGRSPPGRHRQRNRQNAIQQQAVRLGGRPGGRNRAPRPTPRPACEVSDPYERQHWHKRWPDGVGRSGRRRRGVAVARPLARGCPRLASPSTCAGCWCATATAPAMSNSRRGC